MGESGRLADVPLIAILRGLPARQAAGVGEALIAAGVRAIETPLGSPEAFSALAELAGAFGRDALIGAGTVLTPDDVDRAKDAGAALIVSPNTDRAVIRRAKDLGLVSVPGCFSPSEAFVALDAGADALKLFPAGTGGPAHLKALRDVLPKSTLIYVVGGVDASNLADYAAAGASGAGVGGSLYRPGKPPGAIAEDAKRLAAACRAAGLCRTERCER